jgi:hypothetical protein
MEMHDLLCYVRLAETKTLPEETRARILAKLQPAVDQAVARDPATWAAYGLQPLTVVNSPDSPFAAMLAGAIEANLDYQIEQQQADGSWGPNWSWADSFPAAWAQAEQEWRGLFTVKTLKTVQNFGRLE